VLGDNMEKLERKERREPLESLDLLIAAARTESVIQDNLESQEMRGRMEQLDLQVGKVCTVEARSYLEFIFLSFRPCKIVI